MPKQNVIYDPVHIPDFLGERLPKPLAVGLDLATNTGLAAAFFDPAAPDPVKSVKQWMLGQLSLGVGPHDSGPLRWVKLRQSLIELKPSLILIEDVRYTPQGGMNMRTISQIMARTYTQAQMSGALMAITEEFAEEFGIPLFAIGIGQIKKRATGKGNANKVDMIVACNEEFGTDFATEDFEATGVDNIADAAWTLRLGLEIYGKGIKAP